ncbi:MAG: hypothetical protein K8J08_12685 [Thermoanaerobaculia bacterium]|nr:hypothetical protein [Thermoanaerobaculia bacterium]
MMTLAGQRLSLCFAQILLLGTALSGQTGDVWSHDHQDRTWSTDADRVVIMNPFGSVRLRRGDDGEIRMVSNLQWIDSDRPALEISRKEGAESIEVVAVSPEPSGTHRRQVDLTLFVPAASSVSVQTTDGLIDARGLLGLLDLTSERGDLYLRGCGLSTTKTAHGATHLIFRTVEWTGVVKAESTSGEVRVELPHGTSVPTRIATRGEITSDYSIQIERSDASQLKIGLVGGATTPRLDLESYSGPIKLVESLVPAAE